MDYTEEAVSGSLRRGQQGQTWEGWILLLFFLYLFLKFVSNVIHLSVLICVLLENKLGQEEEREMEGDFIISLCDS